MRFEDLDDSQQELLTEAYRQEEVHKLRAWIGIPICAVIAGGAAWVFLVGDDSGAGGILAWPIILFTAGIAGWMLVEVFYQRRVRWMVRSFDLDPQAERELLASLGREEELAGAREAARTEIGDELHEGGHRLTERSALLSFLYALGWQRKRRG